MVHVGERRSMEPFVGRARSMLGPAQHKEWNEGNDIGCVHGVDVSRTESTHTVVMVERRVDAVHTDGVHAELL